MTEEKKMLPLGTAVSIKGDDSAYIIMARVLQKESDDSFIARYKGVPHPWGENPKYKTLTFSEHDIEKVLQEGYETEVDEAFNKEKREAAAPSPVKKEGDSAEVVSKELPKEKPKPKEPPAPSNDPFFNLRKRGKRK